MKNVFFFVALFYSSIGIGQLTAIPDPCFEYNLHILGLDFGDIDGYVTTSSIDTVTSLNFSYHTNGGISDMTGIEDFAALEVLWVIDHMITSLDLSGNPNLRELRCEYNYLVTLNVSNNAKLEDIECDANNLAELDLSMNPRLKRIHCASYGLQCLNLKNGNNHNVPDSDFSATKSNSNYLSCIQVDDVEWSTANWTLSNSSVIFGTTCASECSRDDLIDDSYSSFLVYPNPNEGTFKLDFRTEEQGTMEIVDAVGQVVQTLIIHPYIDNSFDLDLSSGVYFIKINVEALNLMERMVVN